MTHSPIARHVDRILDDRTIKARYLDDLGMHIANEMAGARDPVRAIRDVIAELERLVQAQALTSPKRSRSEQDPNDVMRALERITERLRSIDDSTSPAAILRLVASLLVRDGFIDAKEAKSLDAMIGSIVASTDRRDHESLIEIRRALHAIVTGMRFREGGRLYSSHVPEMSSKSIDLIAGRNKSLAKAIANAVMSGGSAVELDPDGDLAAQLTHSDHCTDEYDTSLVHFLGQELTPFSAANLKGRAKLAMNRHWEARANAIVDWIDSNDDFDDDKKERLQRVVGLVAFGRVSPAALDEFRVKLAEIERLAISSPAAEIVAHLMRDIQRPIEIPGRIAENIKAAECAKIDITVARVKALVASHGTYSRSQLHKYWMDNARPNSLHRNGPRVREAYRILADAVKPAD